MTITDPHLLEPENPTPVVDEHAQAHADPLPPLWKQVEIALEDEEAEVVLALLHDLSAPDIALVLTQLRHRNRHALIELLGEDLDPDVLAELDDSVRDDVLEDLTPTEIADALKQMESDDALSLLEDLDEEEQQAVLDALPAWEQRTLREGLTFPEDSAGRLMRREVMAMPEHWTIGQARLALQDWAEMPEQFYEISVVNPAHQPVGVLPLAQLMRAKPSNLLRDVMRPEFHSIGVNTDQEEVAQIFRRYTVDDVLYVLQAEATEDVLRLAHAGDSDLSAGLLATTRPRFVWLSINLATAMLASWVISFFQDTLQQVIALAVLMPIVASMGGNAGTQTLAVAVRGMATRMLGEGARGRFVVKELLIALLNGLSLGLLIGLFSGLWYQNWVIGVVMGSALVVNLLAASLAGTLIPLTLDRFKIDPAISSGVFVTTVTDVVGFMAFLGFATLVLKWLT
jgi:magnesium transporter